MTVQAVIRYILGAALFLLYPYLVYRSMEDGVVWIAPAVLSGIYVIRALQAKTSRQRLKNLAITLLLLLEAFYLQALTAKLLPVLIQLALMLFFGRTLVKGPPLVERFARLDYPDFKPGIAEYCRQVTVVWTGFFAFNAVVCAVLALWAPTAWWAFYNSVMILLLTGLLMVGEYVWRHYHFPDMEIPSARSSLQSMLANCRKIWMDVQAG